MFNNKVFFQQFLVGSTISLIGVGSITLGTGFDSWKQSTLLNQLSKHDDLKTSIGDLKTLANNELNLNDPIEQDANDFAILLNVIFNGDKLIQGPMWVNWNYKISKFMSLSHNREKYQKLNFKTSFITLLTTPETKLASEKIKAIQPIFNEFRVINENSVGVIVGISFLSLSSIPITILFALAIKNKYFIKEEEE